MTAHARAHRALAESLTLDAIARVRRDLLAAGDRMVATERAARRARAHAFPLGAPWMRRLSVARPHDLLCTCGGINCPPI